MYLFPNSNTCFSWIILFFLILFNLNTFLLASKANSDSLTTTEPDIHPTLLWGVAQLIPSPQWNILKGNGIYFGMRWQLTPLLYSYGINRKLSPWRSFIVEPLVRQGGSIEWFLSPEYINIPQYKEHWLIRSGIRAYFPSIQHGEYLSWSLAAGYYTVDHSQGICYEAGTYFFAGILGIQLTYSPDMANVHWMFTLRIRYF